MVTKQIDKSDPRWVSVQVQARLPWWRREQLENTSKSLGVSLGALITDALERCYPSEPPK